MNRGMVMGDYELFHAERAKHKYIKKIGKRYFYTQEQLRAFLSEKGTDAGEKAKELKTAASNSVSATKTAVAKATQSTQPSKKEAVQKSISNAVKKKERKVRRKVGKAVVSTLAKRSMKNIKKKASKGKESVSKFMKHRLTTGGVTVTYAEAEIKK